MTQMKVELSSIRCEQHVRVANAVCACHSQHDIARVQAREARLCTSGSPGKATTYTAAAAAGRPAGSNAVAGQHWHNRHRCGTAGVAHALLALSNRTSSMKPGSAAVSA